MFNDPEGRSQGIIASGSSIPWRRGSNESKRFANEERCVKEEEFPSEVEFPSKEGFSTEVEFVGEGKTPGEEEVPNKEGFPSDRGFWFGIEELWNQEWVSDSVSRLSSQESQLEQRANCQYQWIHSKGIILSSYISQSSSCK